MTKEDWIDQCAERFQDRGGLSMSEAIEYAGQA